jgi:hypothetical protein
MSLPLAAGGVAGAGNDSTNGCVLANVFGGFARRQALFRRKTQRTPRENKGYQE